MFRKNLQKNTNKPGKFFFKKSGTKANLKEFPSDFLEEFLNFEIISEGIYGGMHEEITKGIVGRFSEKFPVCREIEIIN